MNNTVLANKEVNVLQAINLTLATSAFLALADSLPKLVDFAGKLSIGKTLYVSLLIFWTVKLLVENHKSFAGARVLARPGYAVFQLMMTVVMFLALSVSAKNADHFILSVEWLGVALSAGLVWLFGLAISFGTNFDRRLYPWIWPASAIVTVVGAFFLANRDASADSWTAAGVVGIMLLAVVFDAIRSKSFSAA